jgi:hypothetical protein
MLYPLEETRKALYEGAKRAMAAIPDCKPYKLELPIKAKKESLLQNSCGAGCWPVKRARNAGFVASLRLFAG